MSHSRHFNRARIDEIKDMMGIAKMELTRFVKDAKELAKTNVSEESSVRYFIKLFHPQLYIRVLEGEVKVPQRISDLATWEWSNMNLKRVPRYMEEFAGSDLPTCRGTKWGLVQATNHVYDHVIGRSVDTRLEAVWTGKTAQTKLKALAAIKEL